MGIIKANKFKRIKPKMFKLLLPLSILLTVSCQTYQMDGNPYSKKTDITSKVIRARTTPLHDRPRYLAVDSFYPNKPGKYPLILWLGGMFSIFPDFIYQDVLESLAKKGFVVTYMITGQARSNMTRWDDLLDWTLDNVDATVYKNSTGTVQVDTTNIALVCHSSGCDMLKYWMINRPSLVKSFLFLDPVLGEDTLIQEYTETNALVTFESSQLCSRCCMWNKDLPELRANINSNVLNFYSIANNMGHCSMLNYLDVQLCLKTKFCKEDEDWSTIAKVSNYHKCFIGKQSAYFTDAFFNRPNMRTYYQEADKYCTSYQYTVAGSVECEGNLCIDGRFCFINLSLLF